MTKPKIKMQTSERIIRLQEVIEKTGLSKSSIYRLAADPDSDFPAAVKLTMATVGWYESLIDEWIQSRQAA
jgi:prophage regulatory protein